MKMHILLMLLIFSRLNAAASSAAAAAAASSTSSFSSASAAASTAPKATQANAKSAAVNENEKSIPIRYWPYCKGTFQGISSGSTHVEMSGNTLLTDFVSQAKVDRVGAGKGEPGIKVLCFFRSEQHIAEYYQKKRMKEAVSDLVADIQKEKGSKATVDDMLKQLEFDRDRQAHKLIVELEKSFSSHFEGLS